MDLQIEKINLDIEGVIYNTSSKQLFIVSFPPYPKILNWKTH